SRFAGTPNPTECELALSTGESLATRLPVPDGKIWPSSERCCLGKDVPRQPQRRPIENSCHLQSMTEPPRTDCSKCRAGSRAACPTSPPQTRSQATCRG